MRDVVAATLCCLATTIFGFVVGFACSPPPEVIKIPGEERIVVKEVEVIVPFEVKVKDSADAATIGKLTADLEAEKSESAKNLSGWRKTYELWKVLYDREYP